MNKLLIALLLVLLSACTSYVANRIQHPAIAAVDLPAELQASPEYLYRWCPHAGKPCMEYIDIPASAELIQFGKIQIHFLDFTFGEMQEELDLTARADWAERNLVMVLFPGYAANKQSVLMYALWFHSQGYRVIVAPGPNDAENFDFGQTTAGDIQQLLNRQPPADTQFVAVGFSMGIIAATAFSQAEPRVAGAIGIAPMQRFDLAATAYKHHFAKKSWSWLVSDKKLSAALEQTLEQADITLEETDVRTRFFKPTLLLASESDQIAPYRYYKGLNNPCVELVKLDNFQHMQAVSFPWASIRQPVEQWLDSITEQDCY